MASLSHLPTAVKICGVTQPDQALAIADLGADYLGFNFWPQSKRYLPLEKAGWLPTLPHTVERVGVFVNPELRYLEEIAAADLVSHFQLHGDESPDFCVSLQEKGFSLIKAFQVRDQTVLASIADYPVRDILLDAYHPGERGGLGVTFPWQLALEFKRLYPERRLFLAGGLTPDNVAQAVQGVRPYALDVASGVEDHEPGVKNLEKVARFIQQAKAEELIKSADS